MHKMPDLLVFKTEMMRLRMATLTLLNFSRHVSAIASCRLTGVICLGFSSVMIVIV